MASGTGVIFAGEEWSRGWAVLGGVSCGYLLLDRELEGMNLRCTRRGVMTEMSWRRMVAFGFESKVL